MIKILMSDDDLRIHQSCIEEAKFFDVELICFEDWESAELELQKNFDSYAAVILDGKGKLNADSKEGDGRHAVRSVGWLKEQKGKGRHVPTVIYTAYLEDLDAYNQDNLVMKLFDKHSDNGFQEVLNFLKVEVKNNPKNKFRSRHAVVSEFSEKYFSIQNKQILLTVFNDLSTSNHDFMWKKQTLDSLRRLNEALVDTIPLHYYQAPFDLQSYLAKINKENPPKNGKPANMGNRTTKIIEFFDVEYKGVSGDGVPAPIMNVIKNIYYTASSFASHTQEVETLYYPSEEMIQGLVYSHLGCYNWFFQIIKD